jgi:hypothetical protein
MVIAVLMAGCTTVMEGSPSAPSGVLLPPRPREVRLDGVDPCSLLTPEQRAELGLGDDSLRGRSYVELFQGDVSTCTISGFKPQRVALSTGVVTSVGIERWQAGDLAAKVSATTVSGFPALVAMPTRFADYCSVEVDVANGQLLDVQFSDGGAQPPISQNELCSRARWSAEELMSSLLMP